MDKKSLRRLSKNQLIAIIFEEREEYVRLLEEENRLLKEKVAQLERLLKMYENPHTPSSKQRKRNTKKTGGKKPRFPGKPKGSNGGGIQLPPADEIIEHSLDACTLCHGVHLKPVGFFKRTIIDLPEKPILCLTKTHKA